MKMLFIDAENVGLKTLEKITASIIDKVFVFSKSEADKLLCEKSLYLHLSDYPSGSNQADFYIIGYLSRVLTVLDKKQLKMISFELYSNDESLISAFEFQCKHLGANCVCVRTKEANVISITSAKVEPNNKRCQTNKKPTKATEQNQQSHLKLLKILTLPHALNPELQKKLGLSKSDFTKAVNILSKNKQIARTKESKRMWVRCS